MDEPVYTLHRALSEPGLLGEWDGPVWRAASTLAVSSFHPRSSAHRPVTEARLLYDDRCLFGIFRVRDRFVRCVHTAYDSDTYLDSCVELFLQPAGRVGYFAIEINCGGAFSLRYIEDPARTATRFARWTMVAEPLAATIRVAHSLPAVTDPERDELVDWWVEFAWPWAVMAPYGGQPGPLAGQRWRANAFKCADATSHPHWASWAPIGEALNFHQPRYFGTFEFANAPGLPPRG